MRDAALTIAAQRDDYAPSLAAGALRALGGLAALVRRRLAARRGLKSLRHLDDRLLDDIGLTPDDLAGLDPTVSASTATRVLAARAEARRRAAMAEDRWLQTPFR